MTSSMSQGILAERLMAVTCPLKVDWTDKAFCKTLQALNNASLSFSDAFPPGRHTTGRK